MSVTSEDIGAAAPASLTIAEVQRRVAEAAFGKPLITNVLRGQVVEAIIAAALEPEWHWCAADYSSWDFERADGLRLEVKQSATRQSWAAGPNGRAAASFDIAPRTGCWEGPVWRDQPGRAAHIYIFAHHDIDEDHADHRDPGQWTFYALPTVILPDTRRIGIGSLRRLNDGCGYAGLRARVAAVAREVQIMRKAESA